MPILTRAPARASTTSIPTPSTGSPANARTRRRRQPNRFFAARLGAEERARFTKSHPHRIAIKHEHSQTNPEKDWGRYTLAAIDFTFWVLNQRIKDRRAGSNTPENTIVIASSISNRGCAALTTAEQDTRGLIRGVAVSEPNVSLASDARVRIRHGAAVAPAHSAPLLDYYTLINVFQPCASLPICGASRRSSSTDAQTRSFRPTIPGAPTSR